MISKGLCHSLCLSMAIYIYIYIIEHWYTLRYLCYLPMRIHNNIMIHFIISIINPNCLYIFYIMLLSCAHRYIFHTRRALYCVLRSPSSYYHSHYPISPPFRVFGFEPLYDTRRFRRHETDRVRASAHTRVRNSRGPFSIVIQVRSHRVRLRR